MDESYRDIEFELYGNLVQIKNVLSYYDTQDGILDEIDKGIAQIKSKMYNVAVMGEFRRGKSSLINALLGLDVLPSDVTPTTATINRITFGTEPAVFIHFKDGRNQEVDISRLQEYVTKITEENEKTALTIREAVICFPTVICQNHVDIIDTPGLNDDEDMTRTTIDMLKNIDAVIVAVSALSPFSETEKSFVAQLIGTSGIHNIVFVVTFIDQIDEDELPKLLNGIKSRIITMTKEELRRNFADQPDILQKGDMLLDETGMKIFPISAKQALKSFAGNDRKLLQKSRFVDFKEELYKILTAQQSINIVEKTSYLINSSAKRFDNIYKEKFDVLTAEIQRLKNSLEQVGRYYDGKKEQLDAVHRTLDARFTKLLDRPKSMFGEINSLFVSELTKVRVNDAANIKKAIEGGKTAVDQYAKNMIKCDSDTLNGMFIPFGQELSARRQAQLLSCVCQDTDIKLIGEEAFLKRFQDQLHALKKPSFTFAGEVVPNGVNLAHYNVIVHIHKLVAPAVDAYLSELKRLIDAYWSLFYSFVSYDDAQRDNVTGTLHKALNKAETDMLVCQSNYQLHKMMVESLVLRTKELLERFEHRGVNE